VVQGDDIFVGRFLVITALGLYQMAYLISNLPATEISHVISRITFPAFSKLQEKPERLREAYQKVLQVTVSISAPIAGGIFVLASDFISLFLGEKWMSMLPAVKLLVIAGFIRSIAATAVPVFHGVGKPKFDTIGQSIRLFLLAVLIYPLTRYWHLVGASTAVLGSILAATVCFAYWIVNITACGVKNYIRIVAVPLTNSVLMVLSLALVKTYFPSEGCFNFFVSVVFGIVIYVSVSCLTDKMIDYRFFETIKEITKLTDR